MMIKVRIVFLSLNKCVFQLSSYGGYLSYQVKTFGLPSEGMTLLEKRPDVLLMVSIILHVSQ